MFRILYIGLLSLWMIPILAQQIQQAEYFFNTDPGIGQATSIPVTSGESVDIQADISTVGLAAGHHQLYIRVQDNLGLWSLYESRSIVIDPTILPPAEIVAAEYFFDDDPGMGRGTALPITTTADATARLSVDAEINTDGLSAGSHQLYIRLQNERGHWSHYESRLIYIDPSIGQTPEIVAAEYFFNTDPGFGQATPLSITMENDTACIDATIAVPTHLGLGDHFLQVRVQDAHGLWSLYDQQLIQIQANSPQDSICALNPIVITGEVTPATDNNADGMISVTVNHAIGNITYIWEHDANLNSPIADNLAEGNYVVTVQDEGGCQAAQSFTVEAQQTTPTPPDCETNPITITPDVIHATGTNADGSITVHLAHTVGAVTYTWSHDNTLNSAVASNLVAGTYAITITDANTCTATQSIIVESDSIVVEPPPFDCDSLPIQITADVTPATATNADGHIVLTLSHAVGAVTYVWSHDITLNSAIASDLLANTYAVTVTDAELCTATESFVVESDSIIVEPPPFDCDSLPIVMMGAVTNATGTNADGQITISLTNATEPVTYHWSHQDSLTHAIASNLVAGTYELTVMDANNCTATQSFIVESDSIVVEPPPFDCDSLPIVMTGAVTNATGTNADGQITISLTNATEPVTYHWSHQDSLTHAIASNLVGGTYELTVTDANNCTATHSFMVESDSIIVEPPPFDCDSLPIMMMSTITPATIDSTNGQIEIDLIHATEPVTYHWSHNNNLNSATASDLAAGTYELLVIDGNDCRASTTIIVETAAIIAENPDCIDRPITIEFTEIQHISCAPNTGRLTVMTNHAQGLLNYQWSHDPNWRDATASELSPGDYSVTVTDGRGCRATISMTLETLACDEELLCHIPIQDYCTPPNTAIDLCIACEADSSGQAFKITSIYHYFTACTITQLSDSCLRYAPVIGMELFSPEYLSITYCSTVDPTVCKTTLARITIGECIQNDPPIAINDSVFMTTLETLTPIAVLQNDSDPNGDSLTITTHSQPNHGTVSIDGNQFNYLPNDDFIGIDSFTYQICDKHSECDEATVYITIEAGESCETTSYYCREPMQALDHCPTFCRFGRDATYTITDIETTFNCGIQLLSDHCFRYRALPLFAGEESIRITAQNELGEMDTAYVVVQVMNCEEETDSSSVVTPETEVSKRSFAHQHDLTKTTIAVQLSPIPAQQFMEVQVVSTVADPNASIIIYDILGQVIWKETIAVQAGTQLKSLDVSVYPSGMYLLAVKTRDGMISTKWLKE